MNTDDKELSRFINIIVQRVSPERIFLFGSRAKGMANDKSDYDILVIVKDKKNTRKMERDLYHLKARERVGIPVDLIVAAEEKFERLKNNRYLIYNQVSRYGKKIYEKETTSSAVA
jgi:predicted nucleotidyltransferase